MFRCKHVKSIGQCEWIIFLIQAKSRLIENWHRLKSITIFFEIGVEPILVYSYTIEFLKDTTIILNFEKQMHNDSLKLTLY